MCKFDNNLTLNENTATFKLTPSQLNFPMHFTVVQINYLI